MRLVKIIMAALAVLLGVAAVSFVAWTRLADYPAFPQAAALGASARTEEGWLAFGPSGEAETGLILYPGGLVDAAAYAPLAQQVAAEGILSVIVPMPFGLAVLGTGRGQDVIDAHPEIRHWMIGGHSLGGAMAAGFVEDNPGATDGLVLLAAYPAGSTDLSSLSLDVISLYGSEDDVVGDEPRTSLDRLPDGTELIVIGGGNHAQFGDYGPQRGDGVATISREAQQRQTVQAISELARVVGRD